MLRRRVFFSFHYEHDSWRVSQVRNAQAIRYETSDFVDAAAWEGIKRRGDNAIFSWIDKQLQRTSVTVVLIGRETASRRFVKYEIAASHLRGNGLLGIYIHDLKDRSGDYDLFPGDNPFDDFEYHPESNEIEPIEGLGWFRKKLSSVIKTYSWKGDDGFANFSQWIEEAAQEAKLRKRRCG